MQFPLQITFEGLEPSEAIRAHVERQVGRLERLGQPVTNVRVGISIPHRHGRRPAQYRVVLDARVPHMKPVVVRATRSDDVYRCVSEAVESATRVLSAWMSRRRVRRPARRLEGLAA